MDNHQSYVVSGVLESSADALGAASHSQSESPVADKKTLGKGANVRGGSKSEQNKERAQDVNQGSA